MKLSFRCYDGDGKLLFKVHKSIYASTPKEETKELIVGELYYQFRSHPSEVSSIEVFIYNKVCKSKYFLAIANTTNLLSRSGSLLEGDRVVTFSDNTLNRIFYNE